MRTSTKLRWLWLLFALIGVVLIVIGTLATYVIGVVLVTVGVIALVASLPIRRVAVLVVAAVVAVGAGVALWAPHTLVVRQDGKRERWTATVPAEQVPIVTDGSARYVGRSGQSLISVELASGTTSEQTVKGLTHVTDHGMDSSGRLLVTGTTGVEWQLWAVTPQGAVQLLDTPQASIKDIRIVASDRGVAVITECRDAELAFCTFKAYDSHGGQLWQRDGAYVPFSLAPGQGVPTLVPISIPAAGEQLLDPVTAETVGTFTGETPFDANSKAVPSFATTGTFNAGGPFAAQDQTIVATSNGQQHWHVPLAGPLASQQYVLANGVMALLTRDLERGWSPYRVRGDDLTRVTLIDVTTGKITASYTVTSTIAGLHPIGGTGLLVTTSDGSLMLFQ